MRSDIRQQFKECPPTKWCMISIDRCMQEIETVNSCDGTFATFPTLLRDKFDHMLYTRLEQKLSTTSLLKKHIHRWKFWNNMEEPAVGTYRLYIFVSYEDFRVYIGIAAYLTMVSNYGNTGNEDLL